MAVYDISEATNAVQITKDGNEVQAQKGEFGLNDPTNDNILYISREGRIIYKIDTGNDTITVNSVPFVGDSNDLKDTINPFFFNASSISGGAQTLSNVVIQEDINTALQPVINQGNEGTVGLSLSVTITDATKEDIIVLGHISSIVGSTGNSELTFRTYINNVLASETDPYRVGNTAQSLDFRTASLRPLNAAGVFTLEVRVFAVSGNITIDNTDGSRIEAAQNKSVTIQTGAGGGGGAVDSVFTRTGAVVAENGDYTVGQVTNAFDSTGDTMSGDIDMDTNNIINATNINGVPLTTSGGGTNFLADDGVYKIVAGGGSSRYILFSLAEEVQNSTVYFASWTQVDVAQAILSGASGGINNPGEASPVKLDITGTITEASITVKGVGVQNGSVSYPVNLNVAIERVNPVGLNGQETLGTINYSIPSDVGTFSVGNTNHIGNEAVSIAVTAGDLLSAKFVNGSGASIAGQVKNVFISLKIE